jgi:hypothetical protein
MITVERFQDADRKWWVRETIKKGDLEVVMLYKCDTAGESMSLKKRWSGYTSRRWRLR